MITVIINYNTDIVTVHSDNTKIVELFVSRPVEHERVLRAILENLSETAYIKLQKIDEDNLITVDEY